MKKVLFGCLGLLGLLVIAAVIGVMTLPSTFEVKRTKVVTGTPDQVYAVVSDLHTWPDWTVWSREADPSAVWDWTGPESGEGAVMSWKGDVHQTGKLTLKDAVPGTSLEYDLAFTADGREDLSTGGFTFTAQGDKTEVVWVMNGDLEGVGKIMGPVMDVLFGPMFETGLIGLDDHMKSAPTEAPAAETPSAE